MQARTYLVLILFNFLIDFQYLSVLQVSNASESRPSSKPEENPGLIEGDIIPPPVSTGPTGRGVGIRPSWYHQWAGGVVPYEFASNVTVNNSNFIVQQMRAMENLTAVNNVQCIRFRPKNATDQFYITIFNGSGCSAPVGSWGSYVGVRGVSLLDGYYSTCMVSGIIQHELTHVLGFYHEQSRPDRDSYVNIQWSNIDPSMAFNFDKYNNSQVDTQNTSYDYGSVMHYDRYAFAVNMSAPTIITIQNASAYLGQRIQLSPTDILEIQLYYGCLNRTSNITNTSTTTASSGTSSTISTTNANSIGTTGSSTSAGSSTIATTSANSIGTTAGSSATTTTTTTQSTTDLQPDAKTIAIIAGASGGALLVLIIVGALLFKPIKRCLTKNPSVNSVRSHKTTSNTMQRQTRPKYPTRPYGQ